MSVADRLRKMGLELPPPFAAGDYVPAVHAGDLVFVSGSGPQLPDGRFVTGKVGADVDVEHLDRVKRIVKLLGFVNSAPGFNQQPAVIDGASRLLISLFGDRGRHARSAVGMAELPFDIAVEIEMVVQVA